MKLLDELKSIMQSANNFEKCKNFYYESHICQKTGNNKKVKLDFKLSNYNTNEIMRFGACEDCGKVFYCYDFESSSF